MTGEPRPVLILRPAPGADTTVRRAEEAGLRALAYPLFEVQPLPWEAPDPANFEAILLTSPNTLRHGGDALSRFHELPAFAVGSVTAKAARDHGFASITTAGPNATATLAAIAAAGHHRVLHLAGEDVRPSDPGSLLVTRRAVYKSAEAGDAQGLRAVLTTAGEATILIHSPRAASRLASLLPAEERAIYTIVAISPPALATIGDGWCAACAAPEPTDAAMLAMARQICQ